MAKMHATKAPRSFMILVAGAFNCRCWELKGDATSLSGHSRQSHLAVFREEPPALLGENKYDKVLYRTYILILPVDQRQCRCIGIPAGGRSGADGNIGACWGCPVDGEGFDLSFL